MLLKLLVKKLKTVNILEFKNFLVKNKKLVIILVSAILVLALLVVGIVQVVKKVKFDKDPKNHFSLTGTEIITTPGTSVQVPITLNKNTGMWAASVQFTYDSKALKFEGVTNGEIFDDCEVNVVEEGKIALLLQEDGLEDTTASGVIFTLNFKTKISSDDGEYKIDFSDECEFVNIIGNQLELQLESPKIIIR